MACPAVAQDGWRFRNFRVEEGLSQNTVWCSLQDSHGYIWLGTKDGLNRFDGKHFHIYRNDPTDSTSIGNNFIRSIIETPDAKALLIGTDNGLYRYDVQSDEFSTITIPTEDSAQAPMPINTLLYDHDGKLWIGSFGYGIFIHDSHNNTWQNYRKADTDTSLKSDLIWKLYRDSNDVIWIGTLTGGLSRFNPTTKEFTTFTASTHNNIDDNIYELYEDSNHRFWIGTWNNGLVLMNRDDNTFMPSRLPRRNTEVVRCISEIAPDFLIIGGNNGLFRYNPTSGVYSEFPTGMPSDRHALIKDGIYSILQDREHGIWIGGYFGGVNYTHERLTMFHHHQIGSHHDGTNANIISQIIEADDHRLWIATEDNGLASYNLTDNTSQVIALDNIATLNFHSLLIDGSNLWVGTVGNGIEVLDLNTWQRKNYNFTHGLGTSMVYALLRASSGNIYAGAINGLFRYDRNDDQFVHITDIGPDVYVYDMIEDSDGKLWIATYGNGLISYDPKHNAIQPYVNDPRDPKSISSNKVICLTKDRFNNIWAGTEGGGMSRYNRRSDNFTNISKLDGLPNDVIYGILEDNSGSIWVSTNKGLACYNPSERDVQLYVLDDGLQSEQFNYKSSIKLADGTLCFGGINGFTRFRPEDIKHNSYIPPVTVYQYTTGKKSDRNLPNLIVKEPHALPAGESIILEGTQPYLDFEYIALSFVSPSKNQYAFRLKGLDDNWVNCNNETRAVFRNLPPGNYEFQVKGSNGDGIWNESIVSVPVMIKPRFYQSLWAYILYGIISIAIIAYAVWHIRNRAIRKRHIKQLLYENERQNEYYKSQLSFFTNVAHEIRTPLSLISAPLEDIEKFYPEDNEFHYSLDIMKSNTRRLLTLVNQLLDFRKMSESAPKLSLTNTDISSLISGITRHFNPLAKKLEVKMSLHTPDDPVIAQVDAEAMTRIISNLIFNGLRYTRSSIEISLEKSVDNNTISISIADNGLGIPDNQKDKIFMPFYRMSPNETVFTHGTGIGLAIVKELTGAHKGHVRVIDTTGGGATFVITLPIIQSSDSDITSSIPDAIIEEPNLDAIQLDTIVKQTNVRPEATLEAGNPKSEDWNILIVEDNAELREYLFKKLGKQYQVFTAENGRTAMAVIQANYINLVISDVIMSEVSGIELCQWIKTTPEYSHINVILITACTEDSMRFKGLEVGADAYVEKPFSTTLLLKQIQNLESNQRRLKQSFVDKPWLPYKANSSSKYDEEFVNNLNDLIENNLNNSEFDICEMASALNMSRSSLHRKIKGLTNMTPNDYLRLYRLKRAAAMLSSRKYKISEVCYLVGFNTPSYFARCFQLQFGLSPTDFMANLSDE